MGTPVCHKIQQNNFWLSPERMLYWEEKKALILSDLHFGKTGHFRKAGIPVPQSVYKEDLQRLVSQLQFFQPAELIVVGDMFHSAANKELDFFKKWRQDFSSLQIHLIKGNHDILSNQWYQEMGLTLHTPALNIDYFSFVHDPTEMPDKNLSSYYFSGHIHPGIRISGLGKQALQFPCFYFTANYCVLPAFSRFTGLAMIKPQKGESVFGIVNQSIIKI